MNAQNFESVKEDEVYNNGYNACENKYKNSLPQITLSLSGIKYINFQTLILKSSIKEYQRKEKEETRVIGAML